MTRHFFATSLASQTLAPPPPGPTIQRSGSINAETWTNQTVEITGDVTVATGQKLTIGPGTNVVYKGNFVLQSEGEIQAIGTPTQRITFQPDTGVQSHYGVLCGKLGQIKPDQTANFIFQYCDFIKGKKGTPRLQTGDYTYERGGGLCAWDPLSLLVDNCSFTDCDAFASGGGFYFNGDSSQRPYTLSNCTFTDCVAGTAGGGFKTDHGQNHQIGPFTFINCTHNNAPYKAIPVTINTSTDILSAPQTHYLHTAGPIEFTAGTLPNGLALNTPYYAITTDPNTTTATLALTPADAVAGNNIDFTAAGSGITAAVYLDWFIFDAEITYNP